MVFDFDTRELLRVRPNPLSHDKIVRLRRTGPRLTTATGDQNGRA
jgi:hypothetical protein